MIHLDLPSPITDAKLPLSGEKVRVKRDDLIHPYVCGNKWRKLKGFIADFHAQNKSSIVSCGGWYSNHLHATSYYCYKNDIPFYALLPERSQSTSYLIEDMKKWNTEIIFVPHKKFRELQDDVRAQEQYQQEYDAVFIPEGGNGPESSHGLKELVMECEDIDFKYFCTAVGTGTTIASLQDNFAEKYKVLGVKLFRDGGIQNNVEKLIGSAEGIQFYYNEDFPRYGKISENVIKYMDAFYGLNSYHLDPIYTVKLFNMVDRLIVSGDYSPSDLLLYHSGGLQARRSLL